MVWRTRLGPQDLRELDTSNGCQDHTVSPYATTSFVCVARSLTGNPPCDCLPRRRCRVHRIPHATSVTIAIRPSDRAGWDESVEMICPTGKVKYFFARGWTRG